VTGATGKVGAAVVRAAIADGHEVRALIRDAPRAARMLPAAAVAVVGDVTEPATLPAAMAGVEIVINAMGVPEQWLADPSRFPG